MDKRNFLGVGRYGTSTFNFFIVFWDTLLTVNFQCHGKDWLSFL